MAAIRFAALALAIVTCAWFALATSQAHNTNAASGILSGYRRLPAAPAKHASDLLNAAGTLNPDRQVDVLRAELATAEGKHAAARQILVKVVREEPKNLQAWLAYALASPDDQTTFFAAVNEARRLDPRGQR